MPNKMLTIRQIDSRIHKIKNALQEINDMRPGSLTQQFKDPTERTGAYFQVSYTHKRKSRTDYVKPEKVDIVKAQIEAYKRFKQLIELWVELSIEKAKLVVKEQDNQLE